MAGIFIDLNGDDAEDFVLLGSQGGVAYENRHGEWAIVGRLYTNSMKAGPWSAVVSDLKAGNYTAQQQRWHDSEFYTLEFSRDSDRRATGSPTASTTHVNGDMWPRTASSRVAALAQTPSHGRLEWLHTIAP